MRAVLRDALRGALANLGDEGRVGVEHLSGVGTQGYLQTCEGLAAEL